MEGETRSADKWYILRGIRIPRSVTELMRKLKNAGFEAYAVGGCVRDILTGREPCDWDLTTNAEIDRIKELLPEAKILSRRFGVARIGSCGKNDGKGDGKDEGKGDGKDAGRETAAYPVCETAEPITVDIAVYRREGRYENGKPAEIVFVKNIEHDLPRRDFTVNALALGLEDRNGSGGSGGSDSFESLTCLEGGSCGFKLLDMFGGLEDIEKRTIRTIGDADARFKEDPLRMLRALRITSELDFCLDGEVCESIAVNRKLLGTANAEKVRSELVKLLESENAGKGLKAMLGFDMLHIALGGAGAKRFSVLERIKLARFSRKSGSYESDGKIRLRLLLSCVKKKRAAAAAERLGIGAL